MRTAIRHTHAPRTQRDSPTLLRIALAALLFFPAFTPPADAQEGEADSLPMPVTTHRVTLATTHGPILLDLYGKDAPRAVKNFLTLCEGGYYDGILIHRVQPDLLIQTGCPKTKDTALRSEWGSGGASCYGAPFASELNARTPSYQRGYRRGVVAMANAGPGTNTSQFFILLTDTSSWMEHAYTIFGRVPDLTTVDAIAALPLDDDGAPREPVEILGTTVE